MPNANYQEQILSTANTKFAAVLLTFGKKLRNHMPLEWVEEFASKADYLAYRRKPIGIKPKTQISFNFDPAGMDGPTIFAAFYNHQAEDAFNAVLEAAVKNPETLAQLKAAHSGAVANACSQALQFREFLIKLIKQVPEEAKLVRVRGQGDAFVCFGKHASKEMVAEYLDKL